MMTSTILIMALLNAIATRIEVSLMQKHCMTGCLLSELDSHVYAWYQSRWRRQSSGRMSCRKTSALL